VRTLPYKSALGHVEAARDAPRADEGDASGAATKENRACCRIETLDRRDGARVSREARHAREDITPR